MSAAARVRLRREPPGRDAALPRALERAVEGALSALGAFEDPALPPAAWDHVLGDIARELVRRPSKGIRASLVRAGYRLVRQPAAPLPKALPSVVELVHAGSLLVDDVADGATERRGGAALHHRYGAALAVNAGGWLYFAALDLLRALPLPPAQRLELHERAAVAMARAHQGQALDLGAPLYALATATDLGARLEALADATSRMKTGALLGYAAASGAVAAGGSPEVVQAAERFGVSLGVALQMYDDLSGLLRADRAHKADEDLRSLAPTWGWVWAARALGDDETRSLLRQAVMGNDDPACRGMVRTRLAQAASEGAAPDAPPVGRAAAQARLSDAVERLRSTPHIHPEGLARLVGAARTLEARYV